jgi:hypothetical protein
MRRRGVGHSGGSGPSSALTRQALGVLVPDAHLAAVAIEHCVPVASTDSDFARFPEVRWEKPLLVAGSPTLGQGLRHAARDLSGPPPSIGP